jgi:2'-5' RNA ligase
VNGRDHLRLFIGLPLPPEPLRRLVEWQDAEFPRRRGLRIVPAENLHVTIAFLGRRPAGDARPIVEAIRVAASDVQRLRLTPARYRETRSVGMVVLDDEEGRASRLALRVWEGLEGLGVYERERREWVAHVTVGRIQERPRLAPRIPDLGALSPSEVALYHSVLRPSGAQYEILEAVALGGSSFGA